MYGAVFLTSHYYFGFTKLQSLCLCLRLSMRFAWWPTRSTGVPTRHVRFGCLPLLINYLLWFFWLPSARYFGTPLYCLLAWLSPCVLLFWGWQLMHNHFFYCSRTLGFGNEFGIWSGRTFGSWCVSCVFLGIVDTFVWALLWHAPFRRPALSSISFRWLTRDHTFYTWFARSLSYIWVLSRPRLHRFCYCLGRLLYMWLTFR